jgi:predicted Zn-ribbon and HTH transcriptional regulator
MLKYTTAELAVRMQQPPQCVECDVTDAEWWVLRGARAPVCFLCDDTLLWIRCRECGAADACGPVAKCSTCGSNKVTEAKAPTGAAR